MPNYRRQRVPGGCYFFTVNLLDRQQTLLVEHIDLLRSAFRTVQLRHPFHVDAIAVLPDHLHCVWTLPPSDAEFSLRWAEIKRQFSRGLPVGEYRSSSRRRSGERGVWQRRFWEHVVRDERDYEAHVNYVHYNPVKHGLVEKPLHWPYSSFRAYVRRGILDRDWASSESGHHLDLE